MRTTEPRPDALAHRDFPSSAPTRIGTLIALVSLLGGCALRARPDPAYFHMDEGRLPPTNVALAIRGLGPCTDNPDRTLRLDADRPVNVLVHGCFGSSGEVRGLAQILAFHGQQSACFTYDDRAALARTSTLLRRALDALAEQTRVPEITVIPAVPAQRLGRRVPRHALKPFVDVDERPTAQTGIGDGAPSAATSRARSFSAS